MPSPKKASARALLLATLLGLILLSYAVRVYRLDAQSLWGDEAWSLFHATQESSVSVLRSAHDDGVVPPAYYLILHAWTSAAGQSEFAIRYISVLYGVLAVPALFALGSRLGGKGVGSIAALLQALSPFHVTYSQETRMYAQMILFTILSTYFFWRLFTEPSTPGKMWFGYVVSSGLAVNSHYFSWYVILAHALFWVSDLIWSRFSRWRTALFCLGGQAATLLLFLPWTVYVWERALGLSGQVERMSVPLSDILHHCLNAFSARVPSITAEAQDPKWPILVPFLLLLALALLWPWKRRGMALLVLCISVPILITFLVSFPTLPGWARYFIAASPPYYLLLARGADGLRKLVRPIPLTAKQRVGRMGLVALLVTPLSLAHIHSLHRYYTDSIYWHWDYRGQIHAMAEATRQKEAAIVYNGGHVPFILKYYLPPGDSYTILPSVCDASEEQIRREIATIAAGHEQIWLMRSVPLACDQNHRAAQWLKEHAYQVSETWLENHVFDFYLTPAEPGAFRPLERPLTFGDQFELAEFALNPEHAAPGDAMAVSLRWRTLASMDTDYKFFLILLGPNDEVYSLKDGMPLNWLRPTTLWEEGTLEDDRWGISVRADTPAGTYPLYVGAYDPATGERLPVQTLDGEIVGNKLLIAEVEIR